MRIQATAPATLFSLTLATLLALWCSTAESAQDPPAIDVVDPRALADEVLALDRDFASVAAERGLRVAYERYLASDAMVFRPLPVAAHEWLETHEPASGKVAWEPNGATVACDGSLAITSGTWTYTTSPGGAAESGQYLTAWRREATGDWRIVLDQSIGASAAAARDLQGMPAVRGCPGGEASVKALRSVDGRVGTQVRGRNARGAEVVVPVRTLVTGTIVGGPAADLGLTHGELIAKRRIKRGQEPPVVAVYVRVWSRGQSGWQLQRDLVTPVGSTGD